MGRKKKTVVEKIAEVVDHVIHPHADPAPDHSEAAAKESASEHVSDPAPDQIEKQSSCAQSDLAKHPKFAKFKSQGEIQHD